MNAVISAERPKRSLPLRVLRAVLAISLAAIVAAQIAWTYSGSNSWLYWGDQNGVKVYVWKKPGEDVERFKATMIMHSSMSTALAVMEDLSIATRVGFKDPRLISRDGLDHFYSTMKADMPPPFKPRELVSRVDISQPQRSQLYVTVKAAPGAIAPDSCCVRVSKMDNSWSFTSLPDGKLQVTWVVNMDMGGFVPYFMVNSVFPRSMFQSLSVLQKVMLESRYRNATLADTLAAVSPPRR